MAADPYQLVNLLADGNPSNDPDTALLAQTLRAARQCSGGACPSRPIRALEAAR